MRYQIDQSGKIEDTNKLTIVCFANGKAKTLKISSGEKQKLIKAMRSLEYPGHEAFIKEIILHLYRQVKINPPLIHFNLIGKECLAHKIALETFRGKRKPDMIVKAKDVIKLFYES